MNQHPVNQLVSNLSTIANKYFQVYQKLANKKVIEYNLANDPLQLNRILLKFFNKIFSDPDLMIKYQMSFFHKQLDTINALCQRYYPSSPEHSNKENIPQTDKRFKDKIWQEHCMFAWFKEAYFTYSDWLEELIKEMPKDDFSSKELSRLNFVMKQFLDAIAPSNFPSTNPEVLKAFFDTAGGNFIQGLDNLLNDIENSRQSILIKTSNNEKFNLGENVATTEGKVVYQNKIMQLIHYKPLEDEHYSVPILIVSPFINKYYVLDLHPETSMVKWLLKQNHNVFLISWVNPDESLAQQNFEDYMMNGPIAAIDYISNQLGFREVNAMGYCIGGTLLSATLAYMKAVNDNRIKAASFLTTLVDFEDAGDLSIFIDDHFINEVSRYMEASGGCLDGKDMASTFSLLRSNDMIWPFYVNNYLLGKEAFPFNLLYWNSDSVRMPMALHLFYLKNMYKDNLLKQPNGITLNNKAIDINKIDIPCFSVAAKGDHIVPWQSAFNSAKLFNGPMTFVLADSGHVAGMINHPDKNKYSYWINPKDYKKDQQPSDWLEQTEEKQGSWWLYWNDWAKAHSGELIKAQDPEMINRNIIEDAPGSYVRVKC
jgi:polyhydroxyalkanoate synthase